MLVVIIIARVVATTRLRNGVAYHDDRNVNALSWLNVFAMMGL